MVRYHDREWGVSLHDDHKLFEFLVLDTFQAGLSWALILNIREHLREAFDDFDAREIARYDQRKVAEALANARIIRNRSKITATIDNSKAFLQVQKEFGSFDRYIWQFVNGRPKKNKWRVLSEIPPHTAESHAMSKGMKRQGFKFVGPKICYAFMQAAGLVNDHLVHCFRYGEV